MGALEVLYLGEEGLEVKNKFTGKIPEAWVGMKSLQRLAAVTRASRVSFRRGSVSSKTSRSSPCRHRTPERSPSPSTSVTTSARWT